MILRYIGGKLKAARDLLSLAPASYAEFREPFAGNAPMLWVVPETVKRWINDIDPDLIRYHRAMQNRKHPVIDQVLSLADGITDADSLVRQWQISKLEWYFYNSVPDYIFANRFAYGQILRRSRRGLCSYSYRYKSNGLHVLTRERMEEARRIYHGVKITRKDYSALLDAPGKDVWIVIDPPYFLGDIDHGGPIYEHNFTRGDHVRLRDRLLACNHKWLLTISLCSLSQRLYLDEGHPKWKWYTRPYSYSATLEVTV